MKHTQSPTTLGGPTLDAYRVALELAALLREALAKLRAQNRPLADQAQRATESILLNLAEGAGKYWSTRREQARYYSIARGSAMELQAALHLCRAWALLGSATLDAADLLLDRERAMLYRLIQRAD